MRKMCKVLKGTDLSFIDVIDDFSELSFYIKL
jgi:hypothetical protein